MTPFLDCNIWSVLPARIHLNYYLVEKIYHYNSLTSQYEFNTSYTQVPEFEIQDMYILKEIDMNLVNKNDIPILKKEYGDNGKEIWKIGLDFYDAYLKLQST